ncbi:hypothetical protein P43SY_009077 [Pythium insidiosum]|uniref:Uncharacterized protein n=1 Tax=Pythium insidiosum TaxID=114742 RepID=A0AAD5Q9V5_PYTIN|nr:hypothetical protein P43SY_009077 [Pythium insidiosum]
MYIGPWQEYRLAKIQDDAVQRLRGEWEAHVRAQLPDGDELRIRELMQPLMAKLPALLLAKSGKTPPTSSQRSRATSAAASRRSSRPSSSVSSSSSLTRDGKPEKGPRPTVTSNQETHDDSGKTGIDGQSQLSRQSSGKRSKPVSKKKTKARAASGPGAALAEVEKRKKMFATWLQAHREDASTPAATDGETRLPPLYPDNPVQRPSELISPRAGRSAVSDPFLPPIDSRIASVADSGAVVESDDSFDEDEVNQLLTWTDNLLSPEALDTSMEGLNLDGD